ncbi:hypothetical protein TWF718_000372 [Orbilia javanica]|uniref:Nucleoside phosphorylase domain-containing protein n=1 Tax=Orbilia javanica TaxID=47235 RepID=A0AAN8NF90_9PEZI
MDNVAKRIPRKPIGANPGSKKTDYTRAYNVPQPVRRGYPRPMDQSDFKVAIICALPLEASVVSELFDEHYDEDAYIRARGDSNAYSIGAIGCHNVVLVHMPGMGKVAAAGAAVSLKATFQEIQLAIVVGICGGAPFEPHSGEAVLLGDVVISDGLVQYDLGRQYPDHKFLRKNTPHDNIPRPSLKIRTALAKLKTNQGQSWLQTKTSEYMQVAQQKLGERVVYPGMMEDKLFKSTYRHRHYGQECMVCFDDDGSGDICHEAANMSCKQLRCDERELVLRNRSSQSSNPTIYFGLFASGDTVMKSGEDRDSISIRDGAVAFEMEGAGVWEHFPNSLVIKGVCDYADSHKNKRWQGYAAATAAAVTKAFLENWISEMPTSTNLGYGTRVVAINQAQKQKEIEILKILNSSPYRDQKDRNPDRIDGTCQWFETHPLFRDWRRAPSASMLWVSADPGCGKSVLAKHLADSVLATDEAQDRTTCYFFFKDDFEDQRSVNSALCCILHQLFIQNRGLLSNSERILEKFEISGEKITNSFTELWDVLICAAKDQTAGEIICILDAIDECEDSGRSQLAQALCKLYGVNRDFNLKFLLTSRPYGGIRRGFQPLDIPGLPVIHLSGESDVEMGKIALEIDVFIQTRIQSISSRLKLGPEEQDILLQQLMRVPNRTYLWVHLTLNLIEGDIDIDKAGIIKAASHLPKTVDEAYERILSKSRSVEDAKKLLQIVVAAARPLTLMEMSLALTLEEKHNTYNDLDLKSEERFRESVRDLCGLSVTVINSRVYLLHQTLKEFLVQGPGNPPNSNLKWKHSIQLLESHQVLAKICIQHLLFTEFEASSVYSSITSVKEVTGNFLFLNYSARHWASHVHEAQVEQEQTESILKLCDTGERRCQTWLRVYWASTSMDFPIGFKTLMVISYFGFATALKQLLKLGDIDPDGRDNTYWRSSLSWAAANGFYPCVKLLTKSRWRGVSLEKPQIDSKDRYDRTPLVYAVWNRHVEIVKLLLKKGADAHLKDGVGGTPFSYAICSGNDDLKSLFNRKSDRKSRSDMILGSSAANVAETILLSAAKEGHEDVVRVLLETGKVNIDATDPGWSLTPLRWAAQGGYTAIVQLLLDKGADIEAGDDRYGYTPLLAAVTYDHERIVQILLDRGASIEAADRENYTPLLRAVNNGNEAITKLLLEKGADVEARCIYEEYGPVWIGFYDQRERATVTPLLLSIYRGRQAVTQLLLDKGVNVEATTTNQNTTSLLLATAKGYLAQVRMLINRGADIEAKNTHDITPLLLAAGLGHTSIVQALINRGANMEARNMSDYTPLVIAVKNGYGDMARILVERGADLEAKDSVNKETPLLLAAGSGSLPVLRLLLSHNANIEVQGQHGCTPLLQAAGSGHESAVQMLLEAGANIEARDEGGHTPLLQAVGGGHEAVVRLLLDWRANIEARDTKFNYTPLLWASENGHKTISKLLVSKGANTEAADKLGRTPLLQAARNGHREVVQLFLSKGVNIEAKGHDHTTALLLAAGGGYEEIVLLLAAGGASIETADKYGYTALSCAARNGHELVVKFLLDRNADVDSRGRTPGTVHHGANGLQQMYQSPVDESIVAVAKNTYNATPLLLAVESGHERIALILAQRGANLEAKDKYGRTALLWAARKGHKAMVELFLDMAANIEARDNSDATPLLLAAGSGHHEVVQLLRYKNADIEAEDKRRSTPLARAVSNGHEETVELLVGWGARLDVVDESSFTPLLCAALNGYEGIAKILIRRSASKEIKDRHGCTALLRAVQNGHTGIAQILLEKGADIEAKEGEYGYTALLWAAQKGHSETVQLLVNRNANIEARDSKYGATPLILAAAGGYEPVVQLLIQNGANVDAADRLNHTPLLWAAENGHQVVVRILINRGAYLETKDSRYNLTPLLRAAGKGYEETVQILVASGANIEAQEAGYNYTPLSRAAANGHEGIVRLLLERGARLEAKENKYGRTPLIRAAGNGHVGIVWLLLDRGAEIETREKEYGYTPLLWAAQAGWEGVVKVLLEKGANIEAKDKHGYTALPRAAARGHEGVVKLLLSQGADMTTYRKLGAGPL